MATSQGNINEFRQGDDWLINRTFPLDGKYEIDSAFFTIKSVIDAPDVPNGPNTFVPVFIEINTSPGAYGTISDTGVGSGQCVCYFVVPRSMSTLVLYTEMYFYQFTLFDTSGTPVLRYTPESGSVTTGRPGSTLPGP